MANRLNAPNQFETLAPPWLLTSLDANATQNQAAWNDSSLGFVNGIAADTGSSNNYQVTLPFGSPSAYNPGMTVSFVPANTNTGASTLTVSPLGSSAILTPAGIALNGGEISAGKMLTGQYSNIAPVGLYIMGQCSGNFTGTSASGTQTFNCAGYTSVSIVKQVTAAGACVVLMQNAAPGMQFLIIFQNASGSGQNYGIQLTGGVSSFYSVIAAGGAILGGNFNSSSLAVSNNLAIRVQGTISAPATSMNMIGILG
jgi:hypothetical protein